MNLVDSDVLIDIWRGHPPAKAWLAACTTMPSVPGFVVMELVQNVKNSQELRQALRLTQYFPVVCPTKQTVHRLFPTSPNSACHTGWACSTP